MSDNGGKPKQQLRRSKRNNKENLKEKNKQNAGLRSKRRASNRNKSQADSANNNSNESNEVIEIEDNDLNLDEFDKVPDVPEAAHPDPDVRQMVYNLWFTEKRLERHHAASMVSIDDLRAMSAPKLDKWVKQHVESAAPMVEKIAEVGKKAHAIQVAVQAAQAANEMMIQKLKDQLIEYGVDKKYLKMKEYMDEEKRGKENKDDLGSDEEYHPGDEKNSELLKEIKKLKSEMKKRDKENEVMKKKMVEMEKSNKKVRIMNGKKDKEKKKDDEEDGYNDPAKMGAPSREILEAVLAATKGGPTPRKVSGSFFIFLFSLGCSHFHVLFCA